MSDEMTKPILYSFRRCPYAMRARMSLLESGVEVELREVILRDRPEHMMDISPKGTVPVLLLPDGAVIEESLDIMLWSLDESWLAGDWKELIAVNDGDFKHHLDRYKYNNRYENVLSSEEHREHALSILKTYDERLSNQAYLCGDSISLADLALSPFVRQFANTDRGWFDQLPLLHLHNWLIGILEGDLFKSCMVKHKQWQNGQVPIYLS
jgi:glutathione S-transferase